MLTKIMTVSLILVSVLLIGLAYFEAGTFVDPQYLPLFCAVPFFLICLGWLILKIQETKLSE